MKKPGVKKHTHRYEFIDGVWTCTTCTHYIPKNYRRGSILGLESVCWICNDEFTIEPANMGQVKPICVNCDIDNRIRNLPV